MAVNGKIVLVTTRWGEKKMKIIDNAARDALANITKYLQYSSLL
jgi:hypothetical protein